VLTNPSLHHASTTTPYAFDNWADTCPTHSRIQGYDWGELNGPTRELLYNLTHRKHPTNYKSN